MCSSFSNIFFIHVYSTSRSEPILSFACPLLLLHFLRVYFILEFFRLFSSNIFYVQRSFSLASACFLLQLSTVLSQSSSSSSFSFRVYTYLYIHIFIFIHHHLNNCFFSSLLFDTCHDDEMNKLSLFFLLLLLFFRSLFFFRVHRTDITV